jgi:hypothetical protein
VKNIACSKDFYGLDDLPEGDIPTALARLIRTESIADLSQEERIRISYLASYLMIRTKYSREKMDQMLNGVVQKIIPNLQLGVKSSEYIFNWTNEGFKNYIATALPELAEVIFHMKWFLSVNNVGIPYWTSDNPICRENDIPAKPGFSNLGLRCRGIQIHLPISPTLYLHFLDPERFSNFPNVMDFFDEEVVVHHNYLQVYTSENQIYSKDSNFSLATEIIRKIPQLKLGSGISMKVL